jgi:hypothetical protein
MAALHDVAHHLLIQVIGGVVSLSGKNRGAESTKSLGYLR